MLAHTIAVLAQANEQTTDTILWIIAAVLVIAGITPLLPGLTMYRGFSQLAYGGVAVGAVTILLALTFVSALIGVLVNAMIALFAGPVIDRVLAKKAAA